jgi:hypothetical protein
MPMEVREAGGLYQVVYDNPLAARARPGEAGGFYNMLSGADAADAARPREHGARVLPQIPFAGSSTGLADIHGVPASFGATDEEMRTRPRRRGARRERQAARSRDRGGGDRQGSRRRCRRNRPEGPRRERNRRRNRAPPEPDGPQLHKQLQRMIGRLLDRHARGGEAVPRQRRQADKPAAASGSPARRDNYVNGGCWHENDREHAKRRAARARPRNHRLGETRRRAAWRAHQAGKGNGMTEATTTTVTAPVRAAEVTGEALRRDDATRLRSGWRAARRAEGDATLSRYADVPALAKAHIEAHKVAKSKVIVPGADADDAQLSAFYDAIGRPASPDDYDLRCPSCRSMRGRRKRAALAEGISSRSASWRTRSG